MAKVAAGSKVQRPPRPPQGPRLPHGQRIPQGLRLPQGLIDQLERRHAGMARHMARAVVTLVRWDSSTGVPPQRDAIVRACMAGLDLFLATARDSRPATQAELRPLAQLG